MFFTRLGQVELSRLCGKLEMVLVVEPEHPSGGSMHAVYFISLPGVLRRNIGFFSSFALTVLIVRHYWY